MDTPSVSKIALSLSSWLLFFVGIIGVRAELHPWVNTIALTAVFPMYLWYMAKTNILGLMSQEAMIATVIGAVLFMTLLLEANKNASFSKNLKKHLKEYGKTPKGTAYASVAIAVSLGIGVLLSTLILRNTFVNA